MNTSSPKNFNMSCCCSGVGPLCLSAKLSWTAINELRFFCKQDDVPKCRWLLRIAAVDDLRFPYVFASQIFFLHPRTFPINLTRCITLLILVLCTSLWKDSNNYNIIKQTTPCTLHFLCTIIGLSMYDHHTYFISLCSASVYQRKVNTNYHAILWFFCLTQNRFIFRFIYSKELKWHEQFEYYDLHFE